MHKIDRPLLPSVKHMAKKNRKDTNMSDENFENTENTENTAGAATTEAPKSDERFKMLTLKDGSQMKRKDYILKRWSEKASRSEIAKELTELSGKKIPYQIVFAATKNVAGGPDKAAAAEGAEAQAAE